MDRVNEIVEHSIIDNTSVNNLLQQTSAFVTLFAVAIARQKVRQSAVAAGLAAEQVVSWTRHSAREDKHISCIVIAYS